MRFPRQARIFRGQIDAAPVIGVFFLLLIFLTLKSSLIFKPGIPVTLSKQSSENSEPGGAPLLRINARGHLLYGGTVFREADPRERVARFKERLRADLPRSAGGRLLVHSDPGTDNELIARIQDAARDLNLAVEVQGLRIELPASVPLPGLSAPGLVVSVDLTGRLYFENQAIAEPELTARLKEAVARAPQPLTLVVQADRYADYGSVVGVISRMAIRAGIQHFWLATEPSTFHERGDPRR